MSAKNPRWTIIRIRFEKIPAASPPEKETASLSTRSVKTLDLPVAFGLNMRGLYREQEHEVERVNVSR